MRSRGYSLVECVAAVGLALVLLPALFPPPRPAAEALREQLEVETARLLLEGELERARRAAQAGTLRTGEAALPPERWASAARLDGLSAVRRVRPSEEAGLLEVTVSATWAPATEPDDARREVRLTTLVEVVEAGP